MHFFVAPILITLPVHLNNKEKKEIYHYKMEGYC